MKNGSTMLFVTLRINLLAVFLYHIIIICNHKCHSAFLQYPTLSIRNEHSIRKNIGETFFEHLGTNDGRRKNLGVILYYFNARRRPFVSNRLRERSVRHNNHLVSSSSLFSSTDLPDPTDLFNADIARMISRTVPVPQNSQQSSSYGYNPVDAAERANSMLHHMLKLYESSDGKTAKPNRESFRLVIEGYSNLGPIHWESRDKNGEESNLNRVILTNGAEKVETIYNEMSEFLAGDIHTMTTLDNMKIVNLVLKSYARCSNENVLRKWNESGNNDEQKTETLSFAHKADSILKKYAHNLLDENDMLTPQLLEEYAQSYAYVIDALCHSCKRITKNEDNQPLNKRNHHRSERDDYETKNLDRAGSLIYDLERIYQNLVDTFNDHDCGKEKESIQRILIWAYGDIIEAWSNAGSIIGIENAERFLSRIENLTNTQKFLSENKPQNAPWEKDNDQVQTRIPFLPSAKSYTNTIVGLSRCNKRGSAKRANELLNRMLQIYDTGKWGSKNKPQVVAFNAVISAWSNNVRYDSNEEGNSADMAEGVLNLLEKLFFDESKCQYNFSPNTISYNAAITAWSNCQETASAYKAEELFRRMNTSTLNIKKDSFTYNAMINAWIRSKLGVTSAEKAEKYLQQMEDSYHKQEGMNLKPNVKTYSAVINAWAKSGAENGLGAQRALVLLERMEVLSDSFQEEKDSKRILKECFKPDIYVYTNVIDAFAQSRLPDSVEICLELLSRVEKRSLLPIDDPRHLMPNVRTYTSVILALANSRQSGNIGKAQQLLNRMNDLYKQTGNENVLPNAYTYNYVINCAANTLGDEEQEDDEDNEKSKAFKIALNSFQELRKQNIANSFTYAFFIKACVNLLPLSDVRTKIIEQAFVECCKDGQVTDQVIHRVLRGVDTGKASEIFASSLIPSKRKQSPNTLKAAIDFRADVTRNTIHFKRKN